MFLLRVGRAVTGSRAEAKIDCNRGRQIEVKVAVRITRVAPIPLICQERRRHGPQLRVYVIARCKGVTEG